MRSALFLLASIVATHAGAQTATIDIVRHDPAPSLVGHGIVVTTLITTSDGGPPSGSVSITDGIDGCSATLPQGFCLWVPGTSGTKSLVASYSGDGTYPPATSTPEAHDVELPSVTERVSLGQAFVSFDPRLQEFGTNYSMSGDGRWVAFVSSSDGLVPGDTNGVDDVFVVDRMTGEIERVSVSATGSQASAGSDQPSISDDGNRVAFRSFATDLVVGDTDGDADIFVRDRGAATTLVASINNAATLGNGDSEFPAISGNGEKVVFRSLATNLDGADTNGAFDVYVRDLSLNTTTRVSVTPTHPTTEPNANSGNMRPALSFDGDRIAFDSGASNLLVAGDLNSCPDVFVRRLSDASMHVASVMTNGNQYPGPTCDPIGGLGISRDGLKLAFGTHLALDPSDTAGFRDVYLTDLTNLGGTLSAQVASLSDAETFGDNYAQLAEEPISLSSDGNVVAFDSAATNLVAGDLNGNRDVFFRDVSLGITFRVSEEVGALDTAAATGILSALGDQMLYATITEFGVPGYPNARLRIRHLAEPQPMGLFPEFLGNQINSSNLSGYSEEVSTTVDGSLVAFTATDSHLASGDRASYRDVFVRDRYGLLTERISVALDGFEGDASSDAPSLSADDGRYVAFESIASDLVVGDTNAAIDIFVRDRTGLTTERINRSPAGAEASGGPSRAPRMSGDGRYVVFRSDANNLVASDGNNASDLFLWDRTQPLASRVKRINLLPGGVEDTSGSVYETYDISRDGRFVVFSSTADALVAGSNDSGAQDLYRYEIATSAITLISRIGNGTEGPAGTVFSHPRISDDGNHVAFLASGHDIVTGLQPDFVQAYVRDVGAGTNAHASRCSDGTPTNGLSAEPPGISGDGRYVSFKTSQPACASDDSGGLAVRVLAHDLQTQTTRRVDRLPDGSAPNGSIAGLTRLELNNTGEFVFFASDASDLILGDTNGMRDLFAALNPVFNIDAVLDVETVAPAANNDSFAPASDAAGRFVLFQTDANNLGAGDADAASDIVRLDAETGDVVRFSVNDDETPITSPAIEPSLSADGDVAVFVAEDSGITALFGEAPAKTKARAKAPSWSVLMRNRITGTTQRMTVPAQPGGAGTLPQLASGSTAVVYSATITDPGMGTVGQSAVIVVPLIRVGDVLTPGAPRCVSCKAVNANGSDSAQNADGDSRAPTVSEDGRYVAWETAAKNLTVGTPAPCPTATTEIVLRDLLSGALQRVSTPPIPAVQCSSGSARKPKIDWKGRRVVFESDQPLKPGGGDGNGVSDIYMQDLDAPGLKRVSEAAGGVDGTGPSTEPTISGDGEMVAYVSAADNLDPVEADTNGNIDAHVGRIAGGPAAVRRLSRTRSGGQADSDSHRPAFNYNGTQLAFDSDASNLAPGAEAGQQNVFQRANPLNADLIFGTGFE